MTSATIAAILMLSTFAYHAESYFDCAAFEKLPDGAWTAIKTTRLAIVDAKRCR